MTYPGESTRTAGTTSGGTAYLDVTVDPMASGVTSRVLIPNTVDAAGSGSNVVLVIVAHGRGDNASHINAARFVATRDGCLDRKWVLISSDAHGNAWSNQTALDDYRRCYDWAASIWNVTDVLLHGWSMGGLTVVNLAGKETIPKVRGTVSIDGALSLANEPSIYTAEVRTAYGVASDGSDYAAKTAGFDPCVVSASAWTGKPLFIEASTGDTLIIKANHSDVFVPRVTSLAPVTYKVGSGAHVADANFMPSDVLAFYDAVIPVPPPPPTLPSTGRSSVLARRLLAL